jgi:signal transduction histidine kinase/PAS domain-containing protein
VAQTSDAAVQELQRRLVEAEEAVQALISGQVDAVVDAATGQALLLAPAEAGGPWLAESLFDALGAGDMGSWQWDILRDNFTWSDELYQLHGLPPGARATPLSHYLDHIHPEDRPRVEGRLAAAVREREPVTLNYRITRPGGQERVLRARAVPRLGASGEAARMLAAVHDVTEWVAAQAQVSALNAELETRVRRRTEQLETANRQVSVILETAMEGISAHTPDGRLVYANAAAARLAGFASPEEMLAAGPAARADRVDVRDEAGVPLPPGRHPATRALAEREPRSATLRFRPKAAGEERWVAVRATPLLNAGGVVDMVVVLHHDLTDLKRAELTQRLLAEVGRITAAGYGRPVDLDAIARLVVPDLADWCALYVAPDGDAPQWAAAHAGAGEADVLTALLHSHGGLMKTGLDALARVAASGRTEVAADLTPEALRTMVPDEGIRRALAALQVRSAMVVPLKAHDRVIGALACAWAESGRHYGAEDVALAEELGRRVALAVENARLFAAERAARDEARRLNAELETRVVERTAWFQAANARLEQSQLQLRRLWSHVQAMREAERGRVAREIHEQLGQELTGLKMDVSWVRTHLHADRPTMAARVTSMARLIERCIKSVRRMAADLRPGILDDLGLLPALEWQCQEFMARTGLTCSFESDVEHLDFSGDAATAVFRLFQEALENVRRHAEATRVDVRLAQEGGELVLTVRDDGRGGADGQASQAASVGLMDIRERVLQLGGALSVADEAGRGTELAARIPLGARG